MLKDCIWTRVLQGYNIWKTSCGKTFTISNDFLPSKNEFKYCPYCGKHLLEMEV